jgi:hypothetical protein
MSLALAALHQERTSQCKTNYTYMLNPKPNTDNNDKNRTNIKLSGYLVNVLAALGELSIGLPLDRIKIGLQSGAKFRDILIPNLIPSGAIQGTQSRSSRFGVLRYHIDRLGNSAKYWFAGHTPSIINRCFIYLPGISLLNTGYTNIMEPWICWVGGCPKLISQALIKPVVVSAIISPYVAIFEGLKLVQQLGTQRVYPPEINKFTLGTQQGYPSRAKLPTTTQPATTSQSPGTYKIIRGVINSGNGFILFASFWPTFARESAFISGMCVIQPLATKYLINSRKMDNPETARVLGSLAASFACQTISQPFDVIKTRRECDPAAKWSYVVEVIKEDIKNKGARQVLFSGWMPRCLRGVWTFYSVSAIRDWLIH